MLMVTHEIPFARDASNRIVFMDDGKVSAEGPPNELMAQAGSNERLDAFLSRFPRPDRRALPRASAGSGADRHLPQRPAGWQYSLRIGAGPARS